MTRVRVFTPSYNKKDMVIQNVQSIIAQTHTDWHLTIVDNSVDGGVTRGHLSAYLNSLAPEIRGKIAYMEHDFSEEFRKTRYVPAFLWNNFLTSIGLSNEQSYCFYMSDDDLVEPNCFEEAAKFLDANPFYGSCYFKMRVLMNDKFYADLPFNFPYGTEFTTLRTPLNSVDGGQVIVRSQVLKSILYRIPEIVPTTIEREICCRCDGHFVINVIRYGGVLYAVPYEGHLGSHRSYEASTWLKPMEQFK